MKYKQIIGASKGNIVELVRQGNQEVCLLSKLGIMYSVKLSDFQKYYRPIIKEPKLKGKKAETRVVNFKREECDVYIGREKGEFHYGNPFKIGVDGNRMKCIAKHMTWLKGNGYQDVEPERRKWILKNLEKLRGKRLGCFCYPYPCHGDNYVKLLKKEEDN